jgi:hypothetical protein
LYRYAAEAEEDVDELINKYIYLRDDNGPPTRGVVMDRKEVGEWYKINGERHQVKAGLSKRTIRDTAGFSGTCEREA